MFKPALLFLAISFRVYNFKWAKTLEICEQHLGYVNFNEYHIALGLLKIIFKM